jgi:hypothetical protein
MLNDPAFIKEFTEIVKPLNIKTALEVGCLSGELKDTIPGCQGIELNPTRKDVIKGDFMDHAGHYDLIFSSGFLGQFTNDVALKMIRRMKRYSTYVLNFVPNSDCKGYMDSKKRTEASWKGELDFTLDGLIDLHEKAKLTIVQSGYAGKEWSKRFGGDGSQPYLVWVLGT